MELASVPTHSDRLSAFLPQQHEPTHPELTKEEQIKMPCDLQLPGKGKIHKINHEIT
jgi:hypothetical protein